MKKVFLILIAIIGFSINSIAQTSDMCNIRGIEGAYVTASTSLHYPGTGSSNKFLKIEVQAYNVSSDGAVTVEVNYYCFNQKQEISVSRTVQYKRNNRGEYKGHVDVYGINPRSIEKTKVRCP